MSVYTPPALNAVDFALTAHAVPSIASPTQVLSPYSVPTLTAVNFSLIAYTQPTYQNIGWELLPGGGVNYTLTCSAGSYSYAGVAASLKVAHSLICDAGTYALSGNAATLTYVAGTPEVVVTGGGGYLPYKNHPWLSSPIRRYIEEVEPEIVEAVIEVVAKTVEKRTVQNKDVEEAQAEKALRERLASKHQAWKEMYAQLIRLEYERREQEYEDAQIAMLLFDL